jgi:hypothetical protein
MNCDIGAWSACGARNGRARLTARATGRRCAPPYRRAIGLAGRQWMSLNRLTGILEVHPVKPRTAGGSHLAKYLITM